MNNHKQKGVVSLFIVIFTTLLLTVLTMGFLRIMIQEQEQATNQDLSQSAYDSAMSGVEDAKRVLRACAQGSAIACTAMGKDAPVPAGDRCRTIINAGIISRAGESSETIIQSGGASSKMNQGYTCVIITPTSSDYIDNLTEGGQSKIVPLKVISTTGGVDGVKKITIEWMHRDNGKGGFAGGEPASITPPTAAVNNLLPLKSAWSSTAPAMLRVQAVLPSNAGALNVADLDTNVASTAYLRPTLVNAASKDANSEISLPGSRATSGASPVKSSPLPVICSNASYTDDDYACKVTLLVPDSIGTVPLGSNVAFLRLDALYRNTSYRVTAETAAGEKLSFDSVQPIVDSTGRAGNIYRRVSSRLDMSSFIIPPAAIDITGSLCKDFYVTDESAVSSSSCSTRPS